MGLHFEDAQIASLGPEELTLKTFSKVCATNYLHQKHPGICLNTKSDFSPHWE
jgi:hypothetical protein